MLTMKIGVQTAHTIDALGIDGAFDAYRAAGFDCVDLNLDDRPKSLGTSFAKVWRILSSRAKRDICLLSMP